MFHNSWDLVLYDEMQKSYFKYIRDYIKEERLLKTIYPPAQDLFNAFKLTDFKDIKVVILGQDPYHGEKEAMGLSFSVRRGVRTPPSLRNIFKELNNDLGCFIPNNGYLLKWAEQGVLMLNSVLTVEKDRPASHKGRGWEIFTDKIIEEINKKDTPVVFLLWGNFAKQKQVLITNPIHLVLTSSHPSPFSVNYGFNGCGHFSKTNNFLKQNGITPIDWQIENI